MLLLDTHTLVWLAAGHPSLGTRATRLIDRALMASSVSVSAFTFWEIAMLIERGRLRHIRDPKDLRAQALAKGIQELPIDGVIAIAAAELRAFHGDPADRIILATALEHGATLVTADATLREWKHGLKTIDASR